MALTAIILKANETLNALTTEQIEAIETLSTNDENTVIAKKVGEIHGQYDNDIKVATGLEKPSGIKTYDWLKQEVLPNVKSGIDAKATIDEQKLTISGLEQKLKDSAGDEAVKQQLKDANDKYTQLQTKYDSDVDSLNTKIKDANTAQLSLRIDNEFDKALTGAKFKDIKLIPMSVRDAYIDSAKKKILNDSKPDFIDNGKGGHTLVYRNESGEIKNNAENKLNPFTTKELLFAEIKDILETGKKSKGGGTNPPSGGSGSGTLDLSGAKTQVEADENIVAYLLTKGLTKGSTEFAAQQGKIREENKVSSLSIN